MALVRAERVLETSTTTGTGSLTLGGPVTGYRSFASVMSTNDTCYYAIVAVDSSGRPTGDWETGLGTLTASTTLTRTTVLASSNGGALVNLASGTKQVFLTLTSTEIVNIIADIASKASATKVDVYSSNDTWTRPDGAKFVDVICVGGGQGGQSGGLAASSTLGNVDAAGGQGGGGGVLFARFFIPAEILTPTVSITVGAGGTGGASLTATSTARNSGSSGGSSSFGSYVATSGAVNTGAGDGGSVVDCVAANGTSPTTPNLSRPVMGSSMVGGSSTATVAFITAFNAATLGTAGTAANTNNATATGSNGGDGTTLTGLSAGQISSGGGGGGAAAVTSAGTATACIGGDGGNGGFPGGGGGGGGAAGAQRATLPTGSRSGKGGNGGDGAVIVITRF